MLLSTSAHSGGDDAPCDIFDPDCFYGETGEKPPHIALLYLFFCLALGALVRTYGDLFKVSLAPVTDTQRPGCRYKGSTAQNRQDSCKAFFTSTGTSRA